MLLREERDGAIEALGAQMEVISALEEAILAGTLVGYTEV